MCKASIIIPYYKKKLFIKQTITSILNQTFKNFEVLIIYDDEDKSELFFLKELIKKDKRFKLILNKKNLGAGESRNKGIKNAKGKYIGWAHGDDEKTFDRFKKAITLSNNNKNIFIKGYRTSGRKILDLIFSYSLKILSSIILR